MLVAVLMAIEACSSRHKLIRIQGPLLVAEPPRMKERGAQRKEWTHPRLRRLENNAAFDCMNLEVVMQVGDKVEGHLVTAGVGCSIRLGAKRKQKDKVVANIRSIRMAADSSNERIRLRML